MLQVLLAPKESQRVTFLLSSAALSYVDPEMHHAIDDGNYEFRVGVEGECERYLRAATAAGLRGETDTWKGASSS